MIKIVTGLRNTGKTSYLEMQINNFQPCEGVLSLKVFDKDKFLGYELYCLSSGERQIFIVDDDEVHLATKRLGKFTFLDEGIAFGKNILKSALEAHVNVVIDEVAQMELMEDVFYEEVKTAIELQQSQVMWDEQGENSWDLYLVVRKELLEQVVEKFDIQTYQLIHVKGGEVINGS